MQQIALSPPAFPCGALGRLLEIIRQGVERERFIMVGHPGSHLHIVQETYTGEIRINGIIRTGTVIHSNYTSCLLGKSTSRVLPG